MAATVFRAMLLGNYYMDLVFLASRVIQLLYLIGSFDLPFKRTQHMCVTPLRDCIIVWILM